MKELGLWEEEMKDEIPRSFKKYGDHLLFSEAAFANRNWYEAGEELWKLVSNLYKGKAVAIGGSIQNDSYRTPRVRLIYGDTSIVNFVDNHVKYTWNIEKNMFCSGNVNERHRIGKLNCEGEVIADLFAGIGYFTLPYLVNAKAKFVHACEWNLDATEALRRNLELNGVTERCLIYEGDNREVCPRRIADRVNLGIIPSSEDYWQVACETLSDKGGILYVHQNVTSKFNGKNLCDICENVKYKFNLKNNEKCQAPLECYLENNIHIWNKLNDYQISCKKEEWFHFAVHITHSISSILGALYTNIRKVTVKEIYKIKSYAPNIDHIVYTVECFPL
uniref:tRNA(Phe) (4-demethylwyosine(37)-C(7)) aminocarboxypropyltransferase n=3 Tax=Rhodnius TaxID=13248 RepID=T1HIG6_RHOPR